MDYPQESHTWTIQDKYTVKRLNKATQSDAIDSIIFTMFGCEWFLRFRPNGLSKGQYLGNAFLILYLTGLPPNRSAFKFSYQLSLMETKTVCKKSTTFQNKYMNICWEKGILLTKSLKKLKQFTLSVTIELLAVYDKKGHDVTNEYKIIDEYAQINLENTQTKKQKNKMIHRLSRSKLRKVNKNATNNTNASYASYATGSYDVVECINKIEKLKGSLKNVNTILCKLDDRVNCIESSESDNINGNCSCRKEEKKIDLLDINKDQYAVVMMEVNKMKRAINELQLESQLQSQLQKQKQIVPKIGIDSESHKCSLQTKRLKKWFVLNVKLPQYFDVFVEHDIIDFDILYKIRKDELKEMGIYKIGHQLKILQQIENLMTNEIVNELDEHVIITSETLRGVDDDEYGDDYDVDDDETSNSDELYITLQMQTQQEGNLEKDTDTLHWNN